MTLAPDFVQELKSKESLRTFDAYLSNNKEVLKNAEVKSLHFESMSDWLGALRNTQGTSFDKKKGHLLVRSIDKDTKLDVTIFEKKEEKSYLPEVDNSLKLLKDNGVTIKSDVPITPDQLERVNALFLIAQQKGYGERMKNITIRLLSETENHTPRMSWDESDRILTIPLASLDFHVPKDIPEVI